VQFTVYRPRAIEPARWHPLLVFAHVAERRPGEDAALDPIEEVRRQAEAVLGERAADYGALTQDAGAAIPTDGELVLVPEVEGVEFHPRRRSFLWLEPVHREEFLIRAGADMLGRTARGRLTVFLGHLAIAELALTMRVEAARAQAPAEASHARTYRRIFASYSHRDAAIVEQVEQYARAIGDEYVRDALHLRSGQVWNDRLREMIEQADAFQLFWSWASMQSAFVRQEYEHALALNRASFVRPTYWEDPMPSAPDNPPSSLSRLHFQRIQLAIPAIPPLDGVRAAPRGSSPYATVCARCGTSNPLHDKFCLTCGAGLQAPPSVGDMMIPRDVSHMGKSTPPRGTPIVPSAVLVELGPPRTADPGAEAFGMDAAGRARDAFAPAPPQAQAPRRSPTRPGSAPQSTGQRQTDGPTYFELPEASKKRRAPWIAGGSVALLTVVGFVLLSVHGGHPPDPIPDNPDANREAILRKERGPFELLLREERQHDAAIAQAKAEIDRARLETEVQAAKVRLESLQRQQRELTERMQSARNAAAKAALRAGVHISDECLANPLASGCL
jgi:hypothetical protein